MPRKKKEKPKLSKELILKETRKFLGSHHVQSLSMRKIAAELGCGTMSIYNHFSDKDELLFSLVDDSLSQINIPNEVSHWKKDLKKLIIETHSLLLNNYWLADLWLDTMPGPHRIAFMNSVLRMLSSGNLGEEAIYRGYCALLMHLVGFTQQEISYIRWCMSGQFEEMARDFIKTIPEGHEYLVEHIEKRIQRTFDDNDFEFVLDLILDGLERETEPQ